MRGSLRNKLWRVVSGVNPSSLRGRQSGTAPRAEVPFLVVRVPFQYVIPTTLFIDRLCFLITA